MKIQIIKLEPHDDIYSAREKLTWGKATHILVEWPDNGKVLTRTLDLILLQRQCQDMGLLLGIVTKDIPVKENAQSLKIPIFKSESAAIKGSWRKGKPRLNRKPHLIPDFRGNRPKHYIWLTHNSLNQGTNSIKPDWIRLGLFILVTFSIIVLALAFYPRATIILSPERQLQKLTLPVLASNTLKAVNISGNLPAILLSTTVSGSETIPTTGSVKVPDQFAIGKAQFTNLSNQVVTIPVGTIIVTSDTTMNRFRTTIPGNVDAGLGKTITIPIQAVIEGSRGNVQAGKINGVEGSLGVKLSVINPDPTDGGSDRLIRSVSSGDYDTLRGQLILNLMKMAYNQMLNLLNTGDILIPDSVKINKVLMEDSSSSINQPADELNLSLNIEFSADTILGKDIQELGEEVLNVTIDKNYHAISQDVQIVNLDEPTMGTDQAYHWKIIVSRIIQLNLITYQIPNQVIGLAPSEASKNLIREFPLRTEPKIELFPSWWPRLPLFNFRINISVDQDANTSS
jgi:hypothetical protein